MAKSGSALEDMVVSAIDYFSRRLDDSTELFYEETSASIPVTVSTSASHGPAERGIETLVTLARVGVVPGSYIRDAMGLPPLETRERQIFRLDAGCRYCGQTAPRNADKSCSGCGAADQSDRQCFHCGRPAEDDAYKCGGCGAARFVMRAVRANLDGSFTEMWVPEVSVNRWAEVKPIAGDSLWR